MTENQPVTRNTRNKNRRLLITIALVLLAPISISWLVLQFGTWEVSDATAQGTLVHPARPITGIKLNTMNGEALKIEALQGKWTLVYLDPAACGEACANKAENINITRLALGEKSNRLQGLVILQAIPDDGKLPLKESYVAMTVATINGTNLQKLNRLFRYKPTSDITPLQHIYLLDPLGNLMMRYPHGTDPKWMLQDLRKLLKASRIG